MLKVGLTGGIGSGKSSATRYFQRLNVPILDADQVARDVVAPGQPALAEIAAVFGPQALDEQGALRREWMRTQVFADPAALARLEAILHPQIRQQLINGMAVLHKADYILVDVPLLVEKNYQDLFDVIVVVDCEPEQQRQRAFQRDGSDLEQIERIMANQASRTERLAYADFILDNSASLDQLYQQIDVLHAKLMAWAHAHE